MLMLTSRIGLGHAVRMLAIAALALPAMSAPVQAQARIVALGASNTAGFGVGQGQAYPAQLQQMLRARGIEAQVSNAGISGDTSAGMLARLDSAVPAGTQVVILDPGNNDLKACTEPWRPQRCVTPAQRAATITSIAGRLRGRGVKVLMAKIEFNLIPIGQWQADRRHLTVEGHRTVAARLAPQVATAFGTRR
jgi:acyl-CoA thioesterase-1